MTSHNLVRAQLVDTRCPRQAALDSLLVQVADGDRGALGALYDQLSQTVYLMSLGTGRGPRVSAEVTHDVFIRTWQQSPAYDPAAGAASTWVRAIAVQVLGSAECATSTVVSEPHRSARGPGARRTATE